MSTVPFPTTATTPNAPDWFPQTDWSAVALAASPGSPESAQALTRICQDYRAPLLSYARRLTRPEDAEDMVQGFLLNVISKNVLAKADRSRGKLRSYLLTTLRNYMASAHIAENAVRRGGRAVHLSIDDVEMAAPGSQADDAEFDRAWAQEIMDQALRQTEASVRGDLGAAFCDQLRTCLTTRNFDGFDVQAIAESLGRAKDVAFRTQLHRVRTLYRDALRRAIRLTLAEAPVDEEVEDEIRYLHRALLAE